MLNRSIEPDLQLLAEADMLKLVVRNLINNAIKFSNTGGVINIKAYRKGLEGFISVTDEGLGIALQKQQDVFSSRLKSEYVTNKEKAQAWVYTYVRN